MSRHNDRPVCATTLFAACLLALSGCNGGQDAGPGDTGRAVVDATTIETTTALPLPQFASCAAQASPTLPARWYATALLQDFYLPFLMFAEFTYDDTVAAFQFSLKNRFGLDATYLTTTDKKLYELAADGSSCVLISNDSPFSVPSRTWVNAQAQCVGQAPVLDRRLDWWKTPSGKGANWIWYDSATQLPFRTMYYADAPLATPAPVYEHFTFNYFPVFESVSSTDVPANLALCDASSADETARYAGVKSMQQFLDANDDHQYDPALGTMPTMVEDWIPGMQACSSSSLPPDWPDQVEASAMMTAVSFKPNPFPTRIFYDWGQRAHNATLNVYPAPPDPGTEHAMVALLTGNTGYGYTTDGTGQPIAGSCGQVMPGPQRPDWKVIDGCKCRAELIPNSALNPTATTTEVLWCPTDLSLDQVFWTWYQTDGTPVVFMQSNSSPTAGTGLNLADYYGWAPGSTAPAGTFDIPATCDGAPPKNQPPAVPQECHNCHEPVNPDFET